MLSFEEAAAYLDGVADGLPAELSRELNGGINMVPDEKRDLKTPSFYILGEYIKSRAMGRYIVLYYGSFRRLYGGKSDEELKKHLKDVLIHELTHHNESLAGDHDLEVKDAIQKEHYNRTGEYIPTKDIDLYGKHTER